MSYKQRILNWLNYNSPFLETKCAKRNDYYKKQSAFPYLVKTKLIFGINYGLRGVDYNSVSSHSPFVNREDGIRNRKKMMEFFKSRCSSIRDLKIAED